MTTAIASQDVLGVWRGKCNSCPCLKYMTSTPNSIPCLYCGHLPVQHEDVEEIEDISDYPNRRNSFQPVDGNEYSFFQNNFPKGYFPQAPIIKERMPAEYPPVIYNIPNAIASNRPLEQAAVPFHPCLLCRRKERYLDQRNGTLSPYCSKTCRNNSGGFPACITCNNDIVEVQGSPLQVFQQCRKCRFTYQPSTQVAPTASIYNSPQNFGGPFCIVCRSRPVYNAKSQYCGNTCRFKHNPPCASCQTIMPASCGNAVPEGAAAPYLVILPPQCSKYTSISDQFINTWKHTNITKPKITTIYLIVSHSAIVHRYKTYRRDVESRGNFKKGTGATGRRMGEGNECRRFHGTAMSPSCQLWTPSANSNPLICARDSATGEIQCPLCSVITDSFKVGKYQTAKHKMQLTNVGFGKGIYSTATSSKAHSYNHLAERKMNGKNYRATIVCKIVVGKGVIMSTDSPNYAGPPVGYDSVLANPDPTSRLKYDEVVVYKDEACIPRYLVIYEL